jgi:hypothetical protein
MHGLPRPHLRKPGPSSPAPIATARPHPRGEAFIPDGSPYLGQTILGEPLG